MSTRSYAVRIFALLGALAGWWALGMQYYLGYQVRTLSPAEYTLRFFSYFTVLTNIMVAVTFSAFALGSGSFLTRSKSATAVTLYILMVGIIYNTVLRNLLDLTGIHFIVHRTLHTIIPLAMVIFWMLFVPREGLQWSYAISWLWYPVCYIIYVVILGERTGFYPYPFANVDKLGYPRAILNGISICVGFLVAALLFIALGKKRKSINP